MHDFGPTYVLSFEIKMMVICWFFVLCVRHQKVLIRLNSFTLLHEPKSLIPAIYCAVFLFVGSYHGLLIVCFRLGILVSIVALRMVAWRQEW